MARTQHLIVALSGLLLAASAPASASADSTLRIGVFGLFRPVELSLRPVDGARLRVQAGGETFVLEGAKPARIRLHGVGLQFLVQELAVMSALELVAGDGKSEFVLGVPGKLERRFRGRLVVRPQPSELVAVIVMDREEAVASAVAAESRPDATLEALKAQAVAARSYYAAAHDRHARFDFCDTTHCQFLREPPERGALATLATALTRGLVLTYGGRPLAALYSASCGGRTRSLAEIGLPSDGYPYFPVECSACRLHAPSWETTVDGDEAQWLRSDRPEWARLRIGRAHGWRKVPGNTYRVRSNGPRWVLVGRGAGHAVGLCQLGAQAMAASGASFTEILARYYPGATLTRLRH